VGFQRYIVEQDLAPLRTAHSEESGFFSNSHHFIQQNCTFLDVHGDYIVHSVHMPENIDSDPVFPIDMIHKLCPPSTPLFIGRQDTLDAMEAYFCSEIGIRHICV